MSDHDQPQFYTPYPGNEALTLAWEIDEWLANRSIVEDMPALLARCRDALVEAAGGWIQEQPA